MFSTRSGNLTSSTLDLPVFSTTLPAVADGTATIYDTSTYPSTMFPLTQSSLREWCAALQASEDQAAEAWLRMDELKAAIISKVLDL